MLWDLNEGKHLYSLEAGEIVNALVFSPNRYWLCAATATCIKIFDLESKCVPLTLTTQTFAYPLLPGPSSTSSSPTSPRAQVPGSPSVSRSPGPLTARRSSVASLTTSSVCGPSSHNAAIAQNRYRSCRLESEEAMCCICRLSSIAFKMHMLAHTRRIWTFKEPKVG